MKIERGVGIAKKIEKICAILDVFLVESRVRCMIDHFLLGMQPSNFDHLTSRI